MSVDGHLPPKRHSRKNLLRYVHTQSYSRISGFKGAKARLGTVRRRALAIIVAVLLLVTGLIFVFI